PAYAALHSGSWWIPPRESRIRVGRGIWRRPGGIAGDSAQFYVSLFRKELGFVSVGTTGSIRSGAAQGGGRGGGVSIGRLDQLQEAARALINTAPAICVFFKPRMSGARYVKELADRAVITWDI